MIQRSVVDYTFQRRAALADLRSGRRGQSEICDAHPYLIRAARFHGDKSDVPCPVCRADHVTLVNYVYGAEWKIGSGQAKTARQVADMSERVSEFNVYVVEVCISCDWNHLLEAFTTGVPIPPKATTPPNATTRSRRLKP